jgi:hypothetical protein
VKILKSQCPSTLTISGRYTFTFQNLCLVKLRSLCMRWVRPCGDRAHAPACLRLSVRTAGLLTYINSATYYNKIYSLYSGCTRKVAEQGRSWGSTLIASRAVSLCTGGGAAAGHARGIGARVRNSVAERWAQRAPAQAVNGWRKCRTNGVSF